MRRLRRRGWRTGGLGLGTDLGGRSRVWRFRHLAGFFVFIPLLLLSLTPKLYHESWTTHPLNISLLATFNCTVTLITFGCLYETVYSTVSYLVRDFYEAEYSNFTMTSREKWDIVRSRTLGLIKISHLK